MKKFGLLICLFIAIFLVTIQYSAAEVDSDREARREAERERRREEHRERSRRRMDERRERDRSDRLSDLDMRHPRSGRSRGGDNDDEEDLDYDIDEQIRKRHEERMKDRGHHSSRGRDRRSKIDKKNAPKGIDDEGALYHLSQVTDKQNILRNRVTKAIEKFSPEKQAEIEKDLADYYELEIVVAKNRQQMSKDYNKARDINDKTKRRAYLDGLKEKKDDRRVKDKAARDVAREKYLSIKAKIDGVLDKKSE